MLDDVFLWLRDVDRFCVRRVELERLEFERLELELEFELELDRLEFEFDRSVFVRRCVLRLSGRDRDVFVVADVAAGADTEALVDPDCP